MRGLTIIAALFCIVVSAGSLVAVRPARADQRPQYSSGLVFSDASASWAFWDRGIYTVFHFTAGDYKSRANSLSPGDRAALLWENVYFSFIQIDTNHTTVLREMGGGSGSVEGGRLSVTADHATLKATLPIGECLPSAGVLGPNCPTRTLDLDLELTRDGSPELTHQTSHFAEPTCHTKH